MAYLGNDLQVAYQSYKIIDDISSSFNSSLTSFPLQVGGVAPVPFPINPQQCLISVNGVVQEPDPTGTSGFNLVGSNIVFASAPTTGHSFFGVILAGADYVNVGVNYPSGSQSAPSITFESDLDTGLFNPAANEIAITTNSTKRFNINSSGQVEISAAGSAASPALVFNTDINTGIYSPGADQVAISTNGTGALFVDSSGRVGVGTGSPSVKLEVSGAASSNPEIRCVDGVINAQWYQDLNGYSVFGTFSNHPQVFRTNGLERLRITSDGKLGLGTSSPSELLEIASTTVGATVKAKISSSNNAGTSAVGLATGTSVTGDVLTTASAAVLGTGGMVVQTTTNHPIVFRTNSSGVESGGNERVRITHSGNVGIGTTSPGRSLHVAGGSNSIVIERTDATTSALLCVAGSNQTEIYSRATNSSTTARDLVVHVGSSEALRVDTSGRLLVGTSSARSNFYGSISSINQTEGASSSSTALSRFSSFVFGNAGTADPIIVLAKHRSNSVGGTTLVNSGDFLGGIDFHGADGTNFVSAAEIRAAVDGTPGANDMPGRLVFSTTADGASSPTERMRITSDGTIRIGTNTATADPVGSNVTGTEITSSGTGSFSRDSGVGLYVNRKTNDGTLVSFYQDGTEEGTISVSGTTVTLNGAHLSRWSQLVGIDLYDKTARPEILRGTVMSNLDEMCEWTCPTSGECQGNEQLNKTEISSVDDDPNVAGVFQSWDDDDDTWVNDFYLAMTGDFVIRIAAGTTVQRGDLLCSAGDGTARPQGDRYLKDSTIAKVTSTTVSCTHPDGSYCVPCVLMAC